MDRIHSPQRADVDLVDNAAHLHPDNQLPGKLDERIRRKASS